MQHLKINYFLLFSGLFFLLSCFSLYTWLGSASAQEIKNVRLGIPSKALEETINTRIEKLKEEYNPEDFENKLTEYNRQAIQKKLNIPKKDEIIE